MPKNIVHYLFKVIKPYQKWYLGASFVSLLLAGIAVAQAKVTEILIDTSASGGSFSEIFKIVGFFALTVLVNSFLKYVSGIFTAKFSSGASQTMKRNLARSFIYMPYKKIVSLKSGDAMSSVNSDTSTVSAFLEGDIINLFTQLVTLIFAFIYLMCHAPLLTLISFVYTPIGMFFTLTLNRKMNLLHPVSADAEGDALSVVEQVLSQIPVIKSFVMEKQIRNKVFKSYDKVLQTNMKIAKYDALIQPACSSVSAIPRIIFLSCSGYLIFSGKSALTVGAVFSMHELLSYIIGPSVYFPFLMNGFNKSAAAINRISKIACCTDDIINISSAKNIGLGIDIENMSFSYDGNKKILDNFSLKITESGITVLSGKSGSGKTTLIDLIAGLYQPDSGNIRVSGDISVVSQEPYIFQDTLYENIASAADIGVSETDVKRAMTLAGVNFAECDSLIGDGFGNLSGGQKQRISLARAILSDSPIWLLDEPTSALDPETEKIIIDAIKEKAKNGIVIISAHRSSLFDIADSIVNLDEVMNRGDLK